MKGKKLTRGMALRILRIASGLSQEQLAQLRHVERSRISREESGDMTVSEDVIREVSQILGGERLIGALIDLLSAILDRLHVRPLMPA